MNTLLHQEVANRFRAMPEAEKLDPVLALMRITAEVVRDLMQDSPESVDAFLQCFSTVPRRMH